MMKKRLTRHNVVLFLMTLWALTFVHTIRAATLHEFMGGYDENLLQWAAATSLLGGVARTIFSLESDKRVVRDIASTAGWDALKALFAGVMAFIFIQAIRSYGFYVPNEIRFTAVLVAGWGRMAGFDWVLNAGKDWLEARKVQIIAKPADVKDKPGP